MTKHFCSRKNSYWQIEEGGVAHLVICMKRSSRLFLRQSSSPPNLAKYASTSIQWGNRKPQPRNYSGRGYQWGAFQCRPLLPRAALATQRSVFQTLIQQRHTQTSPRPPEKQQEQKVMWGPAVSCTVHMTMQQSRHNPQDQGTYIYGLIHQPIRDVNFFPIKTPSRPSQHATETCPPGKKRKRSLWMECNPPESRTKESQKPNDGAWADWILIIVINAQYC